MTPVSFCDHIVLIGPVRAGKSTIGKRLALELGLPQVSMDNERWRYCAEIGYDSDLAATFREQSGMLALVLYRNLFDAHAVGRLLAEHHDCVTDFGAGTYESLESQARVLEALAAHRNVFLLLPSPDIEEWLRVLAARDTYPPVNLNFDFNRHFLTRNMYADLAKFTVYTRDRTPAETCREIPDLKVD